MSHAPARDDGPLDEIDVAWQRRRNGLAPLVFGVLGIALSPLLLGLVFGPLSIRAGLDRWRAGVRRVPAAVGIASGLTAIVLSVTAALLWGAVLTSVLLGRDALREAERWRGRTVDAVELAVNRTDGSVVREALRPSTGSDRRIVLAVDIRQQPSRAALEALLAATVAVEDLLIIDLSDDGADLAAWVSGKRHPPCGIVPHDAALPPPLDAIAALPMTLSIDRFGRIEGALIGVRPTEELEKLLSGKMSLDPPPPS